MIIRGSLSILKAVRGTREIVFYTTAPGLGTVARCLVGGDIFWDFDPRPSEADFITWALDAVKVESITP